MLLAFSGMQTRLDAANEALIAALEPLACANGGMPGASDCDDPLSAAAVILPSAPGLCAVDPLSSSEQIPWQGASAFIGAWQSYWMTHQPLVGTPLAGALEVVDQELTAANRPGNTAVLILTDGEITCVPGHADPVVTIEDFRARGISTHVISVAGMSFVPGSSGPVFNDALAAAGGSGTALNPTDTAQLVDAIPRVLDATAQVAGCDVTLDGGMLTNLDDACQRGDVAVDGTPIACDDTDGFQVVASDEIRLFGDACEKLQATGRLTAVFPCDLVVAPD